MNRAKPANMVAEKVKSNVLNAQIVEFGIKTSENNYSY